MRSQYLRRAENASSSAPDPSYGSNLVSHRGLCNQGSLPRLCYFALATVDLVHEQYPKEVPAGEPSYVLAESVYFARFNAEKGQRILGMKYRSMDETARDSAAELRIRGWL